MKKIFLTMTALSALAAAAPAAAQSGSQGWGNQGWGNQGYANANVGISNRIAQLDARLRAGIQAGTITRAEAQQIRPQLRELRRLEHQYSANGMSQQERAHLQQRVRSVRQQLRIADGGRYARHEQYGSEWDDGYGDYQGQGGPYEEVEQVCERRGGIAGIIGSVLGRDDDDCGLRVGQRVSGGLYAVPYEYRNQFRDGRGVYYRSDGQNIYQIDARTHTVVRVYDMHR